MAVEHLRIKYLKNNTNTVISLSSGELIPPGKVIGLTKDEYNEYKNDTKATRAIKNGKLLVSTNGMDYYTNPVDGVLIFENEFDDGGQIMYGDNLIPLTPGVRRDPETGIKGTSLSLALFQILKDFYNDPANPLYSGPQDSVYWSNIPSLRELQKAFEIKMKTLTFTSPKTFTVYNNQPVSELLKYSGVLFQNPNNTVANELRAKSQDIMLIGVADTTLSITNFRNRVNSYTECDGIYMVNSGYGKGTVDSNGRLGFNNRVNYIHSIDRFCIIDCANINHAFGTVNDPLYPNSTWNSGLLNTKITSNDKYLINDFAISSSGFNDPTTLLNKMNSLYSIRDEYNICLMGLGYLDPSDPDKQQKYDTIFHAALAFSLDGVGVTDTNYYKDTIDNHSMFWVVSPKLFVENGLIKRYTEDRRLFIVDLSTGYGNQIEEF